MLSELREEFPKINMLFLENENEISSEYSSLQFWNDNSSSVPKQSETAQNAFLLSLLLVLQKVFLF